MNERDEKLKAISEYANAAILDESPEKKVVQKYLNAFESVFPKDTVDVRKVAEYVLMAYDNVSQDGAQTLRLENYIHHLIQESKKNPKYLSELSPHDIARFLEMSAREEEYVDDFDRTKKMFDEFSADLDRAIAENSATSNETSGIGKDFGVEEEIDEDLEKGYAAFAEEEYKAVDKTKTLVDKTETKVDKVLAYAGQYSKKYDESLTAEPSETHSKTSGAAEDVEEEVGDHSGNESLTTEPSETHTETSGAAEDIEEEVGDHSDNESLTTESSETSSDASKLWKGFDVEEKINYHYNKEFNDEFDQIVKDFKVQINELKGLNAKEKKVIRDLVDRVMSNLDTYHDSCQTFDELKACLPTLENCTETIDPKEKLLIKVHSKDEVERLFANLAQKLEDLIDAHNASNEHEDSRKFNQ